MKVCILGTGRSGTKALYNLLQDLMLENHDRVDFCYEPFLWDKTIFNDRFQKVKHAFGSLNSISIEGIYHHQKLPVFIDDPRPYLSNEYLADLLQPHDTGANILLKFIRANGRIQLLNMICPDLKFIFIIRNPVDSVNSIMARFSFFGGEFHHDDFPRFIDGINLRYDLEYSTDHLPIHFERELLFWYYMNRYALETLAQKNINSLRICYEDYIENPEKNLQNICEFLNYRFTGVHLAKAIEKVGDITKTKVLSEAELSLVLPYWEKYTELLQEFNIENRINKESVLQQYRITRDLSVRTRKYYGFTPVKLIRELEKVEKTNSELKQLLK